MDYVTLMGAEQVANAANTMRSAAENMNRAASTITCALEQHQRWMDDWLTRLQDVIGKQP